MKSPLRTRWSSGIVAICSTLLLLSLSGSARAEEWARLTQGLVGNSFTDVVFDRSNANTLYAAASTGRIYKSVNGGASWIDKSAGLPPSTLTSIVVDPNNGNVYAGTLDNGVYFSTNGGDSWANGGLPATGVQTLAISQGNPAVVYAGTKSGLYLGYSLASGAAPWFTTGLTGNWVYSVAVSPNASNYVYAGTLDSASKLGKLFRSSNGGFYWEEVDNGLSGTVPMAIAIDPEHPGTVYAGTSIGYTGSAKNGLYKSTNFGGTWAKLSFPYPYNVDNPVASLAIAPGTAKTPSTIYAAQAPFNDLLKSQDGGVNWSRIALLVYKPTRLAINPSNPLAQVVATEGGGLKKNVAKSDFNGDGKSDIFVQNNDTGELQVWTMDGTQKVAIGTIDPNLRLLGLKNLWRIVATGDFDGDGLADPVMQNSAQTGEYAVWFVSRRPRSVLGSGYVYDRTGQMTFSRPNTASTLVGVGDFNGDGLADLLWEIAGTTVTHQVWFGNGQGTWPSENRFPFSNWGGEGFRVEAVADFNGDMYADILVRGDAVGKAGIWSIFGGFQAIDGANSLPSYWNLVGVGDYNGDGKTDVIWDDGSNSQLNVWFMDGTTKLGESGPIGFLGSNRIVGNH